jgi:hypothetical protein
MPLAPGWNAIASSLVRKVQVEAAKRSLKFDQSAVRRNVAGDADRLVLGMGKGFEAARGRLAFVDC